MGPSNPLNKQLEYNKSTGMVTKWHVKPYNKVDEIAPHHDSGALLWRARVRGAP